LLNSVFGWFIVGRQPHKNTAPAITLLSTSAAINKLWAFDTIGITDANKSELEHEENALQQFYSNIKMVEQRYEVTWPWKTFPPPLQSNFGQARGHLETLINKHAIDPNFFHAYDQILKKQMIDGVIEDAPKPISHSTGFYLLHHAVIAPEKSTPLPIVYDGSAKPSRQQFSLNDVIYKGRNLLSDLTALLLRFRTHKIVMISDIEKAFHQIRISPADQDYVKFLWIHDPTKPAEGDNLRVLRFTRVTFGIVASPFLLAAVIFYHLKKFAHEFSDLLINSLYADNFLTGLPDVDTAIEFYTFTVNLFRKCSMNLRAWFTNNETVRQQLPAFHTNPSPAISILGVLWNQYTDTLYLKPIRSLTRGEDITLRNVLKISAQFFDPLGFYAPILVRAKLFMQKLRNFNNNWDSSVELPFHEEWFQIQNDLISATSYELPRLLAMNSESLADSVLHGFVDASQNAYAAVLYLQQNQNLFFLCAKARITPKKGETIPELELIAAFIGARLIKFVITALQLPQNIRKILWSDSKCVLAWLETSRILPTFVLNRVREIRTLSNIQFRYIPSEENIADLPSRGTSVDILNQSKWWTGPDWLKNEQSWPQSSSHLTDSIDLVEPEQKTTVLITAPIAPTRRNPFELDPHRFNKYLTLL